MVTVLAVVIVIALGAAAILQAVGSQTNMKVNNLQEVKAQYLAEAGMQYALWTCRTSGCVDNAGFTITVDGTAIPVPIDVTSLPPAIGEYTIETSVTYTNFD